MIPYPVMQMNHTLQVLTLPNFHRDPFDHLIIAQAQLEQLYALTANPQFSN